MSKIALITGITGQDGSYLAELLLDKGYEVHGIIRRSSSLNTGRIDHIFDKLVLHYGDMTDGSNLLNVIAKIRPDEIYNLAAQSHVMVSFETPEYTAQADGVGMLRVLEAVRSLELTATRIYQACTSEMFGSSPSPQNEKTPFLPCSPYGSAKIYSYWIGRNYRESYSMFVANGILFNHESPSRGSNFVTNTVVKTAVEIKLNLNSKLELGNMDSYRDWGHSYDYVRAMHLIVQQDKPGDWVVATGETRSVRDMCKYVFEKLNLNYEDYIIQNQKFLRPEELKYLKGDSTRMRELGWKPEYTFESMMDEMIEFWVNHYNK
jgi:GDPmannose 4,6-dehydratase